jgi:hypothetical protein
MHSLTGFHPMTTEDAGKVISLATDRPIWDRVFGVFPLVIVGSKENNCRYNLAPNHLAMAPGLGEPLRLLVQPRARHQRGFTADSGRKGFEFGAGRT